MKRTSELKWTQVYPTGVGAVDYTKIMYVVSLRLRDISAFTDGVTGLVVSDLTIGGFGLDAPKLPEVSMTINGEPVPPLPLANYIAAWETDVNAGTLSFELALPSLDSTPYEYGNEDLVSIFVKFKVLETGLTLTGSDIGFPDYQPVLVP